MMAGRDRPDTQESMRKMSASLDADKPGLIKRLLSFQTFVSMLLIVLVIITGTAFGFAMKTDRERQERSQTRQELFENHVIEILDSIEDTQSRGVQDRDELMDLLERIKTILDSHVDDGRITRD